MPLRLPGRRPGLATLIALAAAALACATASAAPAPGCAGTAFTDPSGDAVDDSVPVAEQPASPNLDILSGFFDDARSLQELKDELAKKGVIKPITTLAARAKEVVEAGYLERDHGTVDDRKLWVYSKSKKPPIQ